MSGTKANKRINIYPYGRVTLVISSVKNWFVTGTTNNSISKNIKPYTPKLYSVLLKGRNKKTVGRSAKNKNPIVVNSPHWLFCMVKFHGSFT